MSDSQAKPENDFKSETKYKHFSSAVEKALRTFEGLTEWHDLISSLARINKVCGGVRMSYFRSFTCVCVGVVGVHTISSGSSANDSL